MRYAEQVSGAEQGDTVTLGSRTREKVSAATTVTPSHTVTLVATLSANSPALCQPAGTRGSATESPTPLPLTTNTLSANYRKLR